jgi:hypothetical protein
MVTSDWSDFLVVAWLDTSQSFYHPIIGSPDVTGSIWILCTIGLREHIQYIQSTCIHSTVFKQLIGFCGILLHNPSRDEFFAYKYLYL